MIYLIIGYNILLIRIYQHQVLGILSPRLNSTDEEFLNQSQDFLIQLKQEIEAIRKAHENRSMYQIEKINVGY